LLFALLQPQAEATNPNACVIPAEPWFTAGPTHRFSCLRVEQLRGGHRSFGGAVSYLSLTPHRDVG
jgi:hypothetical protein